MRNVKKAIMIALAVVIAVLLYVSVTAFIQGSLEMHPTAEQIEKGRIGYGLTSFSLIVAEVIIIRRIFK